MNIEKINGNGGVVAVVSGEKHSITDAPTALDMVMTVKYETGADRIAIDKSLLDEDFFILSTGLAGEILQKFVNYHVKVAIFGDYSRYTSKPLRDFIYESNNGRDVFFVGNREEAVRWLSEV